MLYEFFDDVKDESYIFKIDQSQDQEFKRND